MKQRKVPRWKVVIMSMLGVKLYRRRKSRQANISHLQICAAAAQRKHPRIFVFQSKNKVLD